MKSKIPPKIEEGQVVVFLRDAGEGSHMGIVEKGSFGRIQLVEIHDRAGIDYSHSSVYILVNTNKGKLTMLSVSMEVFEGICKIVPEGEATEILYGKE